jgi:FKBP-type peptidyl-prolyl cis-trans isomerase
MKVGGTRLLIIPSTLGYGSTAHGSIPADSTLIFEVRLIEIN